MNFTTTTIKDYAGNMEISVEASSNKGDDLTMTAVKRKMAGTFSKVNGGYAQQIDQNTKLFVPDMCAANFTEQIGELYVYAPNYEAIEADKTPAISAKKPGEYAYYYENQHVPTGCDFSADLAYYGKHYFLKPLHDGLPQLHGRGITYNAKNNIYKATINAYEKLKAQYKIKYEMCFD